MNKSLLEENMERCMKFMEVSTPRSTSYKSVVLGITTKEELMFRLELIPNNMKEVIIAKWGLDGSEYCYNFKDLNLKLGVEDSRSIYIDALQYLAKSKIFICNQDGKLSCTFKDFSPDNFDEYLLYANIRAVIFETCDLMPYAGTLEDFKLALEKVLADILSKREISILKLRFGLNESGKPMGLEKIGDEFNITKSRVRDIVIYALQKVHGSFYSQKLLTIIPMPLKITSVTQLNLSPRVRKNFIHRGFDEIDTFMSFSKERLKMIRGLGDKGVEECLEAQKYYRSLMSNNLY